MASTYTPRIVDGVLERRMRHHPAILIIGPRAAGKTTTAERFARTTIRLDRPGEAAAVRADPDSALRELEEPVLLDEWPLNGSLELRPWPSPPPNQLERERSEAGSTIRAYTG